uniref:Uncharacterized protein n=1 Tax=Sphaerodactylus townsendi TaxID=933632 RepID=A0ACB8EIK9_9SAUR
MPICLCRRTGWESFEMLSQTPLCILWGCLTNPPQILEKSGGAWQAAVLSSCFEVMTRRQREAKSKETSQPADTGKYEKCYVCKSLVPLKEYQRHVDGCLRLQRCSKSANGTQGGRRLRQAKLPNSHTPGSQFHNWLGLGLNGAVVDMGHSGERESASSVVLVPYD